MPLKQWTKTSTEVVKKNDFWEYRLDTFTIGNSFEGEYHYVHTNGSTMVVPLLNDGSFLFVKQYRYLNSKESIEFPGGSLPKDLPPESNALKELREEAKLDAKELIKIGSFNPYNGVTDEICFVFLAKDLFDSPLPGDKTEEFEIIKLTSKEINSLIEKNIIWDGMSIVAWQFAKIYLGIK